MAKNRSYTASAGANRETCRSLRPPCALRLAAPIAISMMTRLLTTQYGVAWVGASSALRAKSQSAAGRATMSAQRSAPRRTTVP